MTTTTEQTAQPSTQAAQDSTKPREKTGRPTRILPSDRIAITKQYDLLRVIGGASGMAKKAVKLEEVEAIIKLKASTVALAIPFFTDSGLLVRQDKGFLPSDAVVAFTRAHSWNPDSATQKLAPVIQETWFAKALLPKLSFRAISVDEAITDLADACAASPDYRGQLSLLLDYLVAAGLVVREGDQLRAGSAPIPERNVAPLDSEEEADTMPTPPPTRSSVTTAFSQPTEGTIQFHVSVRVDMSEFSGWPADRISAFFGGIAQVLAAKGNLEKTTTGK